MVVGMLDWLGQLAGAPIEVVAVLGVIALAWWVIRELIRLVARKGERAAAAEQAAIPVSTQLARHDERIKALADDSASGFQQAADERARIRDELRASEERQRQVHSASADLLRQVLDILGDISGRQR